jgi:ribosomal-protein-alanine N-acetyltransferase
MTVNNIGTMSIETDRLILRRFKSTDTNDMIKNWISNPAVQNDYGEPIYTTIEEVSEILEKWIASYSDIEFYR